MGQFVIILSTVFLILAGCASSRTPSPIPEGASPNCYRYGKNTLFNEQRIQAFQQIILDQMTQVKATPASNETTALLAKLEVIRRRIVPPFLEPKLNPNLVTKILEREAKALNSIYEQDAAAKNPNVQKSLEYLNQNLMPSLQDRDEWGCEQKVKLIGPQNSFEPNDPNAPQIVPSEPNVILEGRPTNPPTTTKDDIDMLEQTK